MEMTYGIVLLPDNGTQDYVRTLIAQQPQNKIDTSCWIHLSLLHVITAGENFSRLCAVVDSVNVAGRVSFECFEILHQKNGWHFLEVRKSAGLLQLQEAILPAADLRAKDTNFSWRMTATTAQQKAYEKYGYPNVGDAWASHFTFGVTGTTNRELRLPIKHSGVIQSLAIGVVGQHATITHVLHHRDFIL